MRVILYTIGCPSCITLEKKLVDKNIEFDKEDNADVVGKVGAEHNIPYAPFLMVDNDFLPFSKAIAWVNKQ